MKDFGVEVDAVVVVEIVYLKYVVHIYAPPSSESYYIMSEMRENSL